MFDINPLKTKTEQREERNQKQEYKSENIKIESMEMIENIRIGKRCLNQLERDIENGKNFPAISDIAIAVRARTLEYALMNDKIPVRDIGAKRGAYRGTKYRKSYEAAENYLLRGEWEIKTRLWWLEKNSMKTKNNNGNQT